MIQIWGEFLNRDAENWRNILLFNCCWNINLKWNLNFKSYLFAKEYLNNKINPMSPLFYNTLSLIKKKKKN